MKHIYFTVTNDLTYDQRMQRICDSLAANGYVVTLVGRELPASLPLQETSFSQKRLCCINNRGFLFYAEYNIRLFFYLLYQQPDGLCAIDLDTIVPVLLISKIKRIIRIYDAHELFTELKEIMTRKRVLKAWRWIERVCVPQFAYGYAVSESITNEFGKRYKRNFITIRNMPLLRNISPGQPGEKFLFYGGAVNEGRGFEYLIPAMRTIPFKLVIAGDGNFMEQLRALIKKYDVEGRVELRGMLPPEGLALLAQQATLGIALAEREGLNQLYALPNKFFDYMHALLPQLTMDYPEYNRINAAYPVASLLPELNIAAMAGAITSLMEDEQKLTTMKEACRAARIVFNWQREEKVLLHYYSRIFE